MKVSQQEEREQSQKHNIGKLKEKKNDSWIRFEKNKKKHEFRNKENQTKG